ncbi:MAG: discoidin domain-containing protein [Gemmataceae bacterium]
MDGDPATLWHSAYSGEPARPPHEIQLDLGKAVPLRALTVLPRQDDNPNGRIVRYAVHVSADARAWGDPIAAGQLADTTRLQTIRFARPVTGRYLRLVVLSAAGGRPFASIAELDIVLEKKP